MGHLVKPRSICKDMTVENTTNRHMWEILVPTVGNDGTPFSVRHHRGWDKKVVQVSGGMTLVQPVRGTWVDSGSEYKERMIPVRLICSEDEIVDICKETARYYDQAAVLAVKLAETVVYITNPHASIYNA